MLTLEIEALLAMLAGLFNQESTQHMTKKRTTIWWDHPTLDMLGSPLELEQISDDLKQLAQDIERFPDASRIQTVISDAVRSYCGSANITVTESSFIIEFEAPDGEEIPSVAFDIDDVILGEFEINHSSERPFNLNDEYDSFVHKKWTNLRNRLQDMVNTLDARLKNVTA